MSFIDIRVFFAKTGLAKYISHLDLYRAMGRAVKRSELPVWITEGFNPHIYMTFALPLALGIEGAEESMDLRLTCELEPKQITQRLNAVMPRGLEVLRVAAPVRKAAEIAKARYEITADEPDKLDAYLSQPEIHIVKKSKRTTREMDVKPLLEWEPWEQGGVLTLPAGNELNISPWNLLSGLNGTEVSTVKRVAILCQDGETFQ